MDEAKAERIERIVDAGAALLLAAAVGFALSALDVTDGLALALSGLAFFACFFALAHVQPNPTALRLPEFASPHLDELVVDELVLTDADRVHGPDGTAATEELLLDRALAYIGPDSRVVRLFEPAAMPTAGELKARIDRHLVESPRTAPPDASQDLYDALAELRRSLR